MASVRQDLNGGLSRPYTSNTFTVKLQQFKALISELTHQDSEASAEERRQLINENLRFDTFCESIRSLFGPDVKNNDLKAIFRKISYNPDANVDWSEIFGYFQTEEEDAEQSANEDVSVFTIAKKQKIGEAAGGKKRRDVIHALVHVPKLDVYVSASQKGGIAVWNSKNFKLVATCDLNESTWTTGIDYLPALRRLAITTERSICVWDHRATGKNQSMFCIKPTENSVHCMVYVPHSNNIHEDCILFGDDQGCINLLTIAAKDLNTKHAVVDRKSGNLVLEPPTLTYPVHKRKVHDDWVLMVKYLADLDCFASCSGSSTSSFVLESVNRITDSQPVRPVSIPKGVNAFAFCSRANIIATGGNDKIVRIWHPHIFSRPTGKLIGHLFTIIDMAVNEKDQHVISLSTARVFRVWDIHTLTSLQVFTDNEERPGEKRIHCILFDEKHERLVSGSSVLDSWPLTRTIQDSMQVPHTHDRPINQILFNAELNQVVTVCSESVIKIWEMESGKLVYYINDSHGSGVEVSDVDIDATGYRLASGAMDGSVKVWDFGSGQEIRAFHKEPHSAKEDENGMLALVYCDVKGQRCIAVIGWNNKLMLLEDYSDHGDLSIFAEFSDVWFPSTQLQVGGRNSSRSVFNKTPPLPNIGSANAQITRLSRQYLLEEEDIVTLTWLEGDKLATGCNSGTIITWNIGSTCPETVFHVSSERHISENQEREEETATHPQRVNNILLLVHKTRKTDPLYIKRKLMRHVSGELHKQGDATDTASAEKSIEDTTKDVSSSEEEKPGIGNIPTSDEAGLLEEKVKAKDESPLENIQQVENSEERKSLEPADEESKSSVDDKPEDDEEEIQSLNSRGHGSEVRSADPLGQMLVTVYDPVLLSCHEDGFIRFWSLEGDILREISAITKRQGSPVTAAATDQDSNLLVTGDVKGYITIWNVADFLKNPKSDDQGGIEQLVSWRAHLSKIVSLQFVNHMTTIISGASDGSARVWYAKEPQVGHFMGFFNQHRPWNYPSTERSSSPVLPYDISERPLRPTKYQNERRNKPQQRYEYPLIFTNDKWKPFRRSAYFQKSSKDIDPKDKKFFDALEKPHFYNDHLEMSKTGDPHLGAVFRALPVYRVGTPKRIKTPAMEYLNTSSGSDNFLFGTPSRAGRSLSPPRDTNRLKPTSQRGKKGNNLSISLQQPVSLQPTGKENPTSGSY